jgi:eukaryotic-like serine/threonine-protein kinase
VNEICAQCGQDLEAVTLGPDGVRTCPKCGEAQFKTAAYFEGELTGDMLPPIASDRFQLRHPLGEGSFGVVWRAFDTELQREVAVKLPKREDIDRDLFLREARAASHLRHPHIVTVFDVVTADQNIFIISELIDGPTLQQWLKQHPPSIEEACRLTITIGQAVDYAHRGGVVHRDLKPSNIVMSSDGAPHVLDFGLSHSRNRSLESISAPGRPIGTPAYMAPEQVLGEQERIGEHTDCYSLGVVLFQMLSGRLPFYGDSRSIYRSILHDETPEVRRFNKDIPASLNAICKKAMEKELGDRYESVAALVADLQRFLQGERVQAYTGYDPRVTRSMVRRYWLATTAGTLGLGCLASLAWAWRRGNVGPSPVRVVQSCNQPETVLTWLRIPHDTGADDFAGAVSSRAGEALNLVPGFYRVVAQHAGEVQEVFRTVPAPSEPWFQVIDGVQPPHLQHVRNRGTIELPEIKFVPVSQVQAGMSFVPGGMFDLRAAPGVMAGQQRRVANFLMDQREVTAGDMRRVLPAADCLRGVPDQEVLLGVAFDVALAYAEAVGKSLPTAWEFLWAATNGGTTRFPWGDEPERGLEYWTGPADRDPSFDQTRHDPPLRALFSGAGEWTETPAPPLFVDDKLIISPTNKGNLLAERALLGIPIQMDMPRPVIERLNMQEFGFRGTHNIAGRVGFRCIRRLSNSAESE